ncbi:hypothetical protein Droror1_Dr00026136 [Drosera rotundifolia]
MVEWRVDDEPVDEGIHIEQDMDVTEEDDEDDQSGISQDISSEIDAKVKLSSSLVVCFGQIRIDFVPSVSGVSLAEAPAFKKAPGGAPANVAVGIAEKVVSAGLLASDGSISSKSKLFFCSLEKLCNNRIPKDSTRLRRRTLTTRTTAPVTLCTRRRHQPTHQRAEPPSPFSFSFSLYFLLFPLVSAVDQIAAQLSLPLRFLLSPPLISSRQGWFKSSNHESWLSKKPKTRSKQLKVPYCILAVGRQREFLRKKERRFIVLKFENGLREKARRGNRGEERAGRRGRQRRSGRRRRREEGGGSTERRRKRRKGKV